jgi:putative FmdB family regulatory protein
MPTYEYKCLKCGEILEIEQSIKDDKFSTHKECGSECDGEVTKLISGTSFQLKGTGWYATDYGSHSL